MPLRISRRHAVRPGVDVRQPRSCAGRRRRRRALPGPAGAARVSGRGVRGHRFLDQARRMRGGLPLRVPSQGGAARLRGSFSAQASAIASSLQVESMSASGGMYSSFEASQYCTTSSRHL